MPLIITLLTAFFCPDGSVFGQGAGPENQLSDIILAFKRINADSSMRKVVLDESAWGDGETDGGGKLIGYFKGDTLYKMSLWVGLSYAVVREAYYFDKGSLILVYESEDDYPGNRAGGGMDHAHPVHTFEGQYYFAGDKAFKAQLWGSKKMGPDDPHHTTELYHNAHYYYGLLLKKKGSKGLAAIH